MSLPELNPNFSYLLLQLDNSKVSFPMCAYLTMKLLHLFSFYISTHTILFQLLNDLKIPQYPSMHILSVKCIYLYN